MKLIIDINDSMVCNDIQNKALEPQTATDKVIIDALYNGIPYEEQPQGELISREALKEALGKSTVTIIGYGEAILLDTANELIDNTPTVDAKPQGEYVDISKLRLMTVEECAGHTIDYAMGWKACIEWIKKGGAE